MALKMRINDWNSAPRHPLNSRQKETQREFVMDHKKEPGDFADKKREEQGRGVIVAGPDAHENEKGGKAPSGKAEKPSPDKPVSSSDRR
ncbi:hypothetical protein P3T31_004251 [Rhizobium sp. AN70]|nr:hypothetical protein [Rhizobium sp. AN70]